MVSGFNPYFLGSAFLVIIAVLVFLTRQTLWALPFAGGALVLYFLGMSQETDDGGDDARR